MTAILKRCSNCKSTKLLETYFGKNKKGLYFKTCDTCRNNRKKYTIEEFQAFAEEKGGKCLSEMYVNAHVKMNWECSEKHEWNSAFHDINRNHWCIICAGHAKHTIEECHDFAKTKDGLCLSTEYKNALTNMSWQCSKKHIWNTRFNDVKNGHWCPNCASHKSEKLCREIFENLLSEPFPTKRPNWLEGLELDGYSEKLNIAFEYNGIQHYEFHKRFHNDDPEEFEKQKARDIKKYSICQKRGLRLIIIPYQYDYTTPDEMREFILSKLN